jgi:hypothetical protein
MERLAQVLVAARQADVAYDPATGLLAAFISTSLGNYALESGIDPERWEELDAEHGGPVTALLNRAQKTRRMETRRRYQRADKAVRAVEREVFRAAVRKFREEHPGEDMSEIVAVMAEAGYSQPDWYEVWKEIEAEEKAGAAESQPAAEPKRRGKRA